jgi:hypothetical protein
MRFVSMNFRCMYRTIIEAHRGKSFHLSPAALSVSFTQPLQLPDGTSGRNRLDGYNLSDDFKIHQRSIKPFSIPKLKLPSPPPLCAKGPRKMLARFAEVEPVLTPSQRLPAHT